MVERRYLSHNSIDRKQSPPQTRDVNSATNRLLVIFALLTLKLVCSNASATSFESRKHLLRSGIRTATVATNTVLDTNIRFEDEVGNDEHDELQESTVGGSLLSDNERISSPSISQLNWQRKVSYSDDAVTNTDIYSAQTLWYMFETAPHYWSPLQWCLLVTFVMSFSSLSFCVCVVCIIPRCCGQRGTMIYAAML